MMSSLDNEVKIVYETKTINADDEDGNIHVNQADEIAQTLRSNHAVFNVNKIYFDEYVKLKDVNSQLIISPPLKNSPAISPLGSPSKKITIKLSDTLQENTTYTFNFAQSIIDNTEGNILDNFKYIFSTGDYIDSLKVKGEVKDAFDLEMLENPTIMLYPVSETYKDSVIYKEKPTYVGSTIDSLNWEITNIKAGTYRLIALNDARKNYIFNPKEDRIGFYSDLISIPGDSIFDLTLFKEVLPFKLVSRPKDVSKGHIIIGFEGDHRDLDIRVLSPTTQDFKSFYSLYFHSMVFSHRTPNIIRILYLFLFYFLPLLIFSRGGKNGSTSFVLVNVNVRIL